MEPFASSGSPLQDLEGFDFGGFGGFDFEEDRELSFKGIDFEGENKKLNLLMEAMNEQKAQIFQDNHHQNTWGFIAKSDQESIQETSRISNESSSISSCSSFDTIDDASSPSSTSSSSSLNSNGSSILDLSDLMSQLPIKRGLSKFYQGKSESFTSLARVMSIEDLPKRIKNPFNKMRKMKSNIKSYGGGLDSFKSHTLPKPIISKKFSPFLRQRSFARSTLVPGQQNN
ncbi:hypothetical protein L1987_70557 [Smallanthus sonchifolius]|uniref:Uncharacterized protein n=1 Tax=Smallanthus sonchifolius TaxID=185202 RepID=A0ACB9ARJ9_9ASTR|nr:hypothetical protein L1987_70557 [Smallanthus sonchifolius]